MIRHSRTFVVAVLFSTLAAAAVWAQDTAGQPRETRGLPGVTHGWRGNWTGLYPDADPPVEWGRVNKGLTTTMACLAAKPAGQTMEGQPLYKGLIQDWLMAGSFPVEDAVADFDKEQIADESALQPAEGAVAAGTQTWRRVQIPRLQDYERWGTTELESLSVDKVYGKESRRIVYAHTYLYADRPGKVAFVFDHHFGLKVWLNGKVLYRRAENAAGLGNYVAISGQKKALTHSRSPTVELELSKGWNRLLLKINTSNAKDWWGYGVTARVVDIDPVPYEEKNIVWSAKLPERGNGAPIVVGDRLFVAADPDELLCVDKATGKILWRRVNTYYHALTDGERSANLAFAEKVAPLVAELERVEDYDKGLDLRRQIRDALAGIDKEKFDPKWDGHFQSHFGIMGFSTTPVSDGQHVYVFYGHGVVACYDLDGKRTWIRRILPRQLAYTCSPALAGGQFVVFMEKMMAYNKQTGDIAWEQPAVKGSIASLIPGRIKGVDVVVSQRGDVVRASDGKVLFAAGTKFDSWSAPAVLGDVVYTRMFVALDFSGVDPAAEEWKPIERWTQAATDNRRPTGEWLDRPTCSSPLVYEGLGYAVDIYGVFYAVDLKTGKTTCKRDLGFDELHSYNHVGVAASVALGGKHVYVMDNQGECVVLDPGPDCKEVARNRLETILQRGWPMPPQEVTNASMVFDRNHVFIRGEQYLYCIGKK